MEKVKIAQSCPTLCDPKDYTVHGILQARILEWVAFPFSRGSSQPRDQTQVPHCKQILYQLSHKGSPTYTGDSRFIRQNSSHIPFISKQSVFPALKSLLHFQGSQLSSHCILRTNQEMRHGKEAPLLQRKLAPAEGSGCRSDGEPVPSESTWGSTTQLSGAPPGVPESAVGLLAKGHSWGRVGQCLPPPAMSPCCPEK